MKPFGRSHDPHAPRRGAPVAMRLETGPSRRAAKPASNTRPSRTSHAPSSVPRQAAMLLAFGLVLAGALTVSSLSNPVVAQSNPALGENVTRTFKLADVLTRRGKISIGTNVPSSLEFEENIVEHVEGRDDLLLAGLSKAKPNLIYFRGKVEKGSSSLDITLEGGKTALFTFEIDPKIREGLRYVIVGKSVPAEDAASSPPPAPTESSPPPAPPRPASQPDASAPVQPLPDWVQVSLPTSLPVGNTVQVPYTLTNAGERELLTDTSRLAITARGRKIAYKLARTNSSGANTYRLPPKTTQAGTLLLDGKNLEHAPAITVSWQLMDASRARFALERTIRLEVPTSQTTPTRTPVGRGMAVPAARPPALNAAPSAISLVPAASPAPEFDRRRSLPATVGVFLSNPADSDALELTLENRGHSSLRFDPARVTVSVTGPASRADARTRLYSTLAPNLAGGTVFLSPGASWSARLAPGPRPDERLPFEFTAFVPVTVDGTDALYRASVLL